MMRNMSTQDSFPSLTLGLLPPKIWVLFNTVKGFARVSSGKGVSGQWESDNADTIGHFTVIGHANDPDGHRLHRANAKH